MIAENESMIAQHQEQIDRFATVLGEGIKSSIEVLKTRATLGTASLLVFAALARDLVPAEPEM